MTDQLLSELRKMRSTRTNLGLLAGMIGLILLTVLLNGFITKKPELAEMKYQYAVLSAGTAAALFAALIGVMAITSEFRHGTIRSTFLVTPRRSRVIAAKVVASLLMGIVFGLVAISISFGVGYAILTGRGIDVALDTGHVVLLVVGTVFMTALWAAMGVGIGAVVRNQVFAVIGVIVWALLVDDLIRALLPDVGRFTPVGASDSVTAGFADYLLAPALGALLLAAYALVVVAAGATLVARRDVT
jgi:ABC-type transport system involved in multi-copper enzyme maturation permease subunit